jgi:hypothetical protein
MDNHNLCLIIGWTYVILASTVGAYYMTKNDLSKRGSDVTLMDVILNIIPSLLLFWAIAPMYLISLTDKIVLNKRNSKSKE